MQEKQKKDAAAAANGKANKQSAGELRLQKGERARAASGDSAAPWPAPPLLTRPSPADISELDLPKNVTISFPDGADKIMNFEILLKPDEGLYK